MPQQLQVVLITGSGAGLGRSLALAMSKAGYTVYAGVRDLKRAESDFPNKPAGLIPLLLDVTKTAHIRNAVKTIQRQSGRLDVLVNNAGYGVYAAVEELSDADMRRQFDTNFFGVVNLTRAVLPLMRKQKSGTIVNVSSILGKLVVPSGSAYTASKWALEAFSETLRYEMSPFGIQVTCVEPGLIRTNFKQNTKFPDAVENPKSPYRHLNRLLKRDYQRFATNSETAAASIFGIIRKRWPAPRYRIGYDAVLYNALRIALPDRCIDWIMKVVVARSIRRAG